MCLKEDKKYYKCLKMKVKTEMKTSQGVIANTNKEVRLSRIKIEGKISLLSFQSLRHQKSLI